MRNPSHPGHVLRDLWFDGSSEAAVAESLGIDPGEFLQLLNGDCPLVRETALNLEAVGWSNAPFWMRLQAYCDLAQTRLRVERSGQFPGSVTPRRAGPLRAWPKLSLPSMGDWNDSIPAREVEERLYANPARGHGLAPWPQTRRANAAARKRIAADPRADVATAGGRPVECGLLNAPPGRLQRRLGTTPARTGRWCSLATEPAAAASRESASTHNGRRRPLRSLGEQEI